MWGWGAGVMTEVAEETRQHQIGLENERPLHADLKQWYARPGDLLESPVAGYQVDIVRGKRLIEIQTRNFAGIKRKLAALLEDHSVRLVHPIPREKQIIRLGDGGELLGKRRSPKHGGWPDVFDELVYLPASLWTKGFSLELLLVDIEELRRHHPHRGWRRRGWLVEERRLLSVVDRLLLKSPSDLARLLPKTLAEPFTVAELAAAMGRTSRLAGRMAYSLRQMGCITVAGKRGNAYLYSREEIAKPPARRRGKKNG
jgi:hypothetical protein